MNLKKLNKRCFGSILAFVVLLILACQKDQDFNPATSVFGPFTKEQIIEITGYSGHAMEPFISRDGKYLFFNNSGKDGENMNIHYARSISDTRFEYLGELPDINTTELEGVPTMDQSFNMYFTTMRSYRHDLHSIYGTQFQGDGVSDPGPVDHQLKKNELGWIIFDSEISENGQTLYYALGKYVNESFPREADLHIAIKTESIFQKKADSEDLMVNINSTLLEYAPAIRNDELELFFTRADIHSTPPQMTMWKSSRKHVDSPFEPPVRIEAIQGNITEGPTISSDGTRLYYHKMYEGRFQLFMVSRSSL